jgi:hypothetical protein
MLWCLRRGGLAGEGSGDATSHDVQSSTRSHFRVEVAWALFLRQSLKPLASADELRDRFGEGETGVKEKGDVPWGSLEIEDVRSSPARSSSGEEISQNRPGRRPNVSPFIPLTNLVHGTRMMLPREAGCALSVTSVMLSLVHADIDVPSNPAWLSWNC